MVAGDSTKVLQVVLNDTPGAKSKKFVDISNLTEEDLKMIQKDDPFMFYSLPGKCFTVLSFYFGASYSI